MKQNLQNVSGAFVAAPSHVAVLVLTLAYARACAPRALIPQRTQAIKKDLRPVFDKEFIFEVSETSDSDPVKDCILFNLIDTGALLRTGACVGKCRVPVKRVLACKNRRALAVWLPIISYASDSPSKLAAYICVDMAIARPHDKYLVPQIDDASESEDDQTRRRASSVLETSAQSSDKGVVQQGTDDAALYLDGAAVNDALMCIYLGRAADLPAMDRSGGCDAYVECWFNGEKRVQSAVVSSKNPVFNEILQFPVFTPSPEDAITVVVRDRDRATRDDTVGYVEIPIPTAVDQLAAPRWLNIYGAHPSSIHQTLLPRNSRAVQLMNAGKLPPMGWRGRILVTAMLDDRAEMLPSGNGERTLAGSTEDGQTVVDPRNGNLYEPQCSTFDLHLEVFSVGKLFTGERNVHVGISIGPHASAVPLHKNDSTAQVAVLRNIELPTEMSQAPLIFLYLAEISRGLNHPASRRQRHLACKRLSTASLASMGTHTVPQWHLLEVDPSCGSGPRDFSPQVLARITLVPHATVHTLWNMPSSTRVAILRIRIYVARNLLPADGNGLSDPYVVASFGNASVRSRTVAKSLHPAYYQELELRSRAIIDPSIAPPDLFLEVYDADRGTGDDLIGCARVAMSDVSPGQRSQTDATAAFRRLQEIPLSVVQNRKSHRAGSILMEFIPIVEEEEPCSGLNAGPQLTSLISRVVLPLRRQRLQLGILSAHNLVAAPGTLTISRPSVVVSMCDGSGNRISVRSAKVPISDRNAVALRFTVTIEGLFPEDRRLWPSVHVALIDNRRLPPQHPVLGFAHISVADMLGDSESVHRACTAEASTQSVLSTSKNGPISRTSALPSAESSMRAPPSSEVDGHAETLNQTSANHIDMPMRTPADSESYPMLQQPHTTTSIELDVRQTQQPASEQKTYAEVHPDADVPDSLSDSVYLRTSLGEIIGTSAEILSTPLVRHRKLSIRDTVRQPRIVGNLLFTVLGVSRMPEPAGQPSQRDKVAYPLEGLSLSVDHTTPPEVQSLSDETRALYLGETQNIVAHLHVLRALHLCPRDANGLADPYLVVRLGKTKIADIQSLRKETLSPYFFTSYALEASLPQCSALTIEVWDKDLLSGDDLIGSASLSLLDRWLARKDYQALAQKRQPVETLFLRLDPSGTVQGTLEVQLHVMDASVETVPKLVPLLLPSAVPFDVRMVVYRARQMAYKDNLTKMNDLYFMATLEAQRNRHWEKGYRQVQETDIHWRARRKGSFNWRLVWHLQLPLYQPRLRLTAWDADLIGSNDFIGEVDLSDSIQKMFTQALGSFRAGVSGAAGMVKRDKEWVKLSDNQGQYCGKVEIEIHVLHQSLADRLRCGAGREQPNEHPKLPPPDRFQFKLWRPDLLLFHLLGPEMGRKVMCAAFCVCGAFLAVLMLPLILSDLIARIL